MIRFETDPGFSGKCGVKQVEVPWARPGSGFTLLFELLVLSLCREMSVAAVAELTSEHSNRLWRILEHYVERARGPVLGDQESAMKRAYGFKQVVYLRIIVYLVAGRLSFSCPR